MNQNEQQDFNELFLTLATQWNPVGALKIIDASDILIYLDYGLNIRNIKNFPGGFNVQ